MSSGQGSRPLSKEEKCSLYSVSSEDYFRCLKSSNVQLFSAPLQALSGVTIAIIIIVIFIILLALDIKYEVNFFSGLLSIFGSLFGFQKIRRGRRY